MQVLQECPFCGQAIAPDKLDDLGLNSQVLQEVRRLREDGKLTETVFLVAKIVSTVQDNPQWVKDLLNEQTSTLMLGIKDSVDNGKSDVLRAVHELMGSPLRGKIQEVSITKRLKAVVPRDSFTTENSTRKGEDIECTALQNTDVAGTIIVKSKIVKTWSHSYIEQVKQYMARKGTQFGMVATTAMPSDALGDSVMIDGVLVVNVNSVEIAYVFLREYLIAKAQLETEYQSKLSRLKVGEQVLHELRNVVNGGGLEDIIATITDDANHIDNLVNKAEDYVQNFANQVKKRTSDVRMQVIKLMSNHIQVIRAKLEPEAIVSDT